MKHAERLFCVALLAAGSALPAPAQDLSAVAARERQRREALKQSPGGPSSFLGAWNGVEDEGGSHRYPTVTFFKDGGRVAYETPTGTTALRLESVKFEGVSVRFLIAGGGGSRFYAGTLDGDTISGKISRDEPGRDGLGSFRLTRGAPSVLSAPADGPGSRMSLAAADAGPSKKSASQGGGGVGISAPAVSGAGSGSGSSSSGPTTDTEMRRQAGEQRLASALSSLAGQANAMAGLIKQYQSCTGASCDSLYQQIGRYAVSIGRGLERAEEEARQNNVLPGRVREMRTQAGLDSRVWDDLSAMVTRLEREYKAKKR